MEVLRGDCHLRGSGHGGGGNVAAQNRNRSKGRVSYSLLPSGKGTAEKCSKNNFSSLLFAFNMVSEVPADT